MIGREVHSNNVSMIAFNVSFFSISVCLLRVNSIYPCSFMPKVSRKSGRVRRLRLWRSVSIKILPTKCTCFCSVPVWFRLRLAAIPAVKRISDNPSDMMRLTSLGMFKSKERMPATKCATLIPFFRATMEHAMVGVKSSTTITRSAGFLSNSSAKDTIIPENR